MLKRFEVENFKGFKDRIVFDLSARDYTFNQELVGGRLVRHALIYGKNGIGKSALGIALFDIINHLTDKKPIDEFDAFLHYEAAEAIVKELNSTVNAQTILTTHNTYLMQNDLTRPDCCFIMTENRITPLCRATNKEIREAHNLEKMYVNGAFGA